CLELDSETLRRALRRRYAPAARIKEGVSAPCHSRRSAPLKYVASQLSRQSADFRDSVSKQADRSNATRVPNSEGVLACAISVVRWPARPVEVCQSRLTCELLRDAAE